MKEQTVPKTQIEQLIKQRFPSLSSPLAQKVSQLIFQKHLFRVGSNKKPVLLINRIKQAAQDQSTPTDVRQFLSSQFLPPSTKNVLQQTPAQKRWSEYLAAINEIYKKRNYLVYPSHNKRRMYQVDIGRGGISVSGPAIAQQGDHHLQIGHGGKLLLDGRTPMTPSERNVSMELMGELFGQLKINPEWSKKKQDVMKTLVARKVYQQGQSKQQPYLTMPVQDLAKLRMTLKSMKSMRYPQQEQNRLISAVSKDLQSYKQVRNALIPLFTTHTNIEFLKPVRNLMLKVPITPWSEFWQQFGHLIYETKDQYDALHNSQTARSTFNEIPSNRNRLLLPPVDARMIVWTFDIEKKALILIIRGLGFEWSEDDPEYFTFRNGSLWRKTYEIMIDISETGIIVVVSDYTADCVSELFFQDNQLAGFPEVDTTLKNIIEIALGVYKREVEPRIQDGDAYYKLPILIEEGKYVSFLPTRTYYL